MTEFRAMRRKHQQFSDDESIGILQKATSGRPCWATTAITMLFPSTMYIMRVSIFHSALNGHKIDTIRQCDKASFCVIEQDDVQPKKYTKTFGCAL